MLFLAGGLAAVGSMLRLVSSVVVVRRIRLFLGRVVVAIRVGLWLRTVLC